MASTTGIYFLTHIEAGKSKIKVSVELAPDEGSLPGLQVVTLCFHMAEGGSSYVSSSSYRGTNPIMGTPPSWPPLNKYFSNTMTLGIRASTYELWEDTNIQLITFGNLFKLGLGPGT